VWHRVTRRSADKTAQQCADRILHPLPAAVLLSIIRPVPSNKIGVTFLDPPPLLRRESTANEGSSETEQLQSGRPYRLISAGMAFIATGKFPDATQFDGRHTQGAKRRSRPAAKASVDGQRGLILAFARGRTDIRHGERQ
jgi:hypothetical protein